MARVVLAMSGGVDSSVAAHLLLAQGHAVVGVFMRHGAESPAAACPVEDRGGAAALPVPGPPPSRRQGCCSAADAADAERVAARLDIPFYALNLQQEFRPSSTTSSPSTRPAARPIPAWCATTASSSAGCSTTRTASAPSTSPPGTTPAWCVAAGATRRSCGAASIPPRTSPTFCLASAGTCCGECCCRWETITRAEIREMAARLGLRVADKPDSQEICFVRGPARRIRARPSRPARHVRRDRGYPGPGPGPTPGNRTFHHRSAEGIGRGGRRAAIRRLHRSRHSARRHRQPGGTGPHATDRRLDQLAGRPPGPDVPLPGQNPLQRPDRSGDRRNPAGRPAAGNLRPAAVRDRPGQAVVCYDRTGCWAAAGSSSCQLPPPALPAVANSSHSSKFR